MLARLPEDDILISLINAGAKPLQVARDFGVKHQTMYSRLQKIERERPGVLDRQHNTSASDIIADHSLGLTAVEIADKRGILPSSVVIALQRAGVMSNPRPRWNPKAREGVQDLAIRAAELVQRTGISGADAVAIMKGLSS